MAAYDPRDYVAYVVADGDGMGEVFGQCTEKLQARALSAKMGEVLRDALGAATAQFMDNVAGPRASRIPVLPLILGGDDLFALVPAPWGLDFTQRLCRAFQEKMTQWARSNGIQHEITMSASVIICKANYPYYLAHQVGERRLGATKRVVKALRDQGECLSAVDFEVMKGSQAAPEELKGKRRPTLRPYWVTPRTTTAVPHGWGLPLDRLLHWRHRLVDTPSRRLSQLRDLFDRAPRNRDADREGRWENELDALFERIERDLGSGQQHPLRRALEDLGGVHLEDWPSVTRTSDRPADGPWRGHGLPDLLRVWDWALDLGYSPNEYEGGAR